MKRLWRWFYNEEWATAVAVIGAIAAQLPAIAELISGEVNEAGEEFSWQGLLLIVAGVIIRYNVTSNKSVERIKVKTAIETVRAYESTPDPTVMPTIPSVGTAAQSASIVLGVPREPGHPQ